MVKTLLKVPQGCVRHLPRLHQAHYSKTAETSLHRYLDDQFVPRFLNDAQQGRLIGTHDQDWFSQDRFGRFQDFPALRQPMHRAFYLACCEVSCAHFQRPAFDPKRVVSAGLVVRRVKRNGSVQRWMVQEGQARGWVQGPIPTHEPSDHRRLLNHRLVKPRFPEPPYSGEETYPVHPLLVQRMDARGKVRSHTLLWGYVPLGGTYREQEHPPVPTSGLGAPALDQEHPWPFGQQQGRAWSHADGLQADNGLAREALRQLLETLLYRYRITDANNPDNANLRTLLSRINFYAQDTLKGSPFPGLIGLIGLGPTHLTGNLLTYLTDNAEALYQWLSRLSRDEASLASERLPLLTVDGQGHPVQGSRTDTLYFTEADARDMRDLLVLRARKAMKMIEEGLALHRFGQAEDDSFVVVPFLRWIDACGCERITWGPASTRFRVASPMDPEAQRPTAIQLPELADLKRGAAKGLSMLAPKSLADVIRKIKPGMAMKQGGPGNQAGICMSFSFSLPAITLCAMILLMVVLNILNLFFWWLPWAFLALPRLCTKSDT